MGGLYGMLNSLSIKEKIRLRNRIEYTWNYHNIVLMYLNFKKNLKIKKINKNSLWFNGLTS